MKLKRLLTSKHTIVALAVLLSALGAQAGFQYNPRELVFGFRQSGGSLDLTVNAGPAANFYNLPVGQSFTVTNVTLTQLNMAFVNLNDVSWSAAAVVRTNGDANYPIQTLWVTSPRSDSNVQTIPWDRKSQFTQANAAAKIEGIDAEAGTY